MVFVSHFPQVTNHRIGKFIYHISTSSEFGYIGVDIFFVLSGFLLTAILLQRKSTKLLIKSFYLGRIKRIFPVYFLVVLPSCYFFKESLFYPLTFSYNLYFPFLLKKYSYEHIWSICVEEHFYIFLPLFVMFFSKRVLILITKYLIPIISILLSFVALNFYSKNVSSNIIFSNSIIRFISLSFGAYLAISRHDESKKEFNRIQFYRLLIILVSFYFGGLYVKKLQLLLSPIFKLILFSCFSYTLVYILLFVEGSKFSVKLLFTNRIIKYVGTISFGIYMYHYPILFGLQKLYPEYQGIMNVNHCLVLIFSTFLISHFSYKYFEKPIMSL